MSLRFFYRNNAGVASEGSNHLRMGALGLVTNAEEGTVGSSSLAVDDSAGAFDIRGHRIVSVVEDAIDPDTDPGAGVLWVGYTAGRDIERDRYRVEDERWWELSVVDLNTVLEREIGTADDWDRPTETDVARLQWLLTTEEASLIDDTTWVSLVDPVDMDANDYRKSRLRDVLDSMAQQSGKNWFLTWVQHPDGGNDIEYSLWYDFAASSNFGSDIRISNFLADVDSSTTFAPAIETRLRRDPSRVYSKVIIDYDGGFAVVEREDTATDFALGGRDATMSAPWIKTKAAAVRYGRRVLGDIATEEDTISTAIMVSGADANAVMAGMRILCRFSHLTDYRDWTWLRVLNRTVRQVVDDVYEIALELTSPVHTPATGDLYGVLLMSHGGGGAVVWEREGGSGTAFAATTGPIAAIIDGDLPDNRDHTGWLIEGDGTIDLVFHATTVGVFAGDLTFTWAIQQNGATVGSEAISASYGGLTGTGHSNTVTVDNLAVSNGDVIKAVVTATGTGSAWFFTVPGGVGDQSERLEITGGSLA